jgi:hypothetical protein
MLHNVKPPKISRTSSHPSRSTSVPVVSSLWIRKVIIELGFHPQRAIRIEPEAFGGLLSNNATYYTAV